MENDEAVRVLAALGQGTRLEAFRLLVKAGPEGMRASDIAEALAVPRNTMSAHLNILARAGLIRSQRLGTTIMYRTILEQLASLASFLTEGCCGGRLDQCEAALSTIRSALRSAR